MSRGGADAASGRESGHGSGEGFQRLADVLPDGVAICAGGRIRWVNASLTALAGHRRGGELVGTPFAELFIDAGSGIPDPETGRGAECFLRRSGRGTRRVSVQRACEGREPGEEAWLVRDVGHERVLEDELLQASRGLHGANREIETLRETLRREAAEREELLTIVSHELRTPVTVIAGYNKLLLSGSVGPLTDEQRRFLSESAKSCQRLSVFIGNLLEASRDLAGEPALEMSVEPLTPLAEGVVESLRPLLEERGLRVELAMDPKESLARFDPVRIERVLTNLIGNAIKHARQAGRIHVAARRVECGGRPYVEVSVEDDGPGVPPADREQIFEPYVQAREGSRAGGLGLGLAICRRLIDAHGGRIGAGDSALGGGRFAFTLPAPGDGARREKPA